MSNISQFFGGGGGVPIGGYVDLPDSAPTVYQDGAATYLRSGATDVSATYPKVPESLLGPIYSNETIIPDINSNINGYGDQSPYLMAKNTAETIIVAFSAGSSQNSKYWRSSDSGVTWTYHMLPSVDLVYGTGTSAQKAAAGVFFFNNKFLFINAAGTVYQSTDGLNFTYAGSSVGDKYILCNNRLFAFTSGISKAYITWSSDGVIWNQTELGGSGYWIDVAHNGTSYIIIDRYSTTAKKCDSTGNPTNTWTNITSIPHGHNTSGNLIEYITNDGSNFLVLNAIEVYNGSYETIYTFFGSRSTDNGVTWSKFTLITGVTRSSSNATNYPYIIKDGSTLRIISRADNYANNWVFKSTDGGVTWNSDENTFYQSNINQHYWSLNNRYSLCKIGNNYISVGSMRYGSFYTAAFLYTNAPYPTTGNPPLVRQITNSQMGPTQIHKVLSSPGDIAVFIDGTCRAYYPSNHYSGSSYGTSNIITGTGSFDTSNAVLTDEFWYFDSTPARDGTGTWSRRKLPYFGAWKCSGYGQNNEFYITSTAQIGTLTLPFQTSSNTITSDYRLYKTTDFLNWTRIVDLPASTMAGLTKTATETMLIKRKGTGFYSQLVSNDGLTLRTETLIKDTSTGTYAACSAPLFYAPTNSIYIMIRGFNINTQHSLMKTQTNGSSWSNIFLDRQYNGFNPNMNSDSLHMAMNQTNGDLFILYQTGVDQICVDHLVGEVRRNFYTLTVPGMLTGQGTQQMYHDPVTQKLWVRAENTLFVSSTAGSDLAFTSYSTSYDTSVSGSYNLNANGVTRTSATNAAINDFAVIDGVSYIVASDGVRRSTPGKYIQNYKYASSAAGTTKYMRVS